jgi:hypothetical protein
MTRIAIFFIALACCLPATAGDVAGKWNLTATDPDGALIKAEMELQRNAGVWSGSIKGPEGTEPLRQISFQDDVLTCTLSYEGTEVALNMKLDGDMLKGRYEADAGLAGRVEASRVATKTAGIAGVWKLTTVGPEGDKIKIQLTLKQAGGTWSGNIVSDDFDAELDLEAIKVDGEDASFDVLTPVGTYKVTAKITGDEFSGTAVSPEGEKNPVVGGR